MYNRNRINKKMRRREKSRFDRLVPLEKSRRVIRLDNRRRRARGRTVGSWFFGILGILCILYCAGIAFFGFGTWFFLIWVLLGLVCLGICIILRSDRLMDRLPSWLKRTVCVLFCLGLLIFCSVEGLILTEYGASAEPGAAYCIVLGAQWKSTGPSEVLRRRLDKAVEYLKENPQTMVIVSGGQGSNEIISEAAGMQGYLIEAGIEPERILVEDASVSTYENLVFSSRFLDKANDRVVIVTNNFHVFRSLGIARKQGYAHVEGLAANSVFGMAPNNLLREFFGVVKDFLVGNL